MGVDLGGVESCEELWWCQFFEDWDAPVYAEIPISPLGVRRFRLENDARNASIMNSQFEWFRLQWKGGRTFLRPCARLKPVQPV